MLFFDREILRFAAAVSPFTFSRSKTASDPGQIDHPKSIRMCTYTPPSRKSFRMGSYKKGGEGGTPNHFCIGKSVGNSGGLLAMASSSGYRRRSGSGTCTLLDLSMLMSSSALTTALPR